MTRTVLDDGRWFDTDKAEKFEESSRWDGNNHISLATGSQWDHEALYRTAGERWILNTWSQYQSVAESYTVIDDSQAADWLVRNHHEHPAVAAEIEELEVK